MRVIIQSVLCFLLGRVHFLDISPVAIATLLVVRSGSRNKNILTVAVLSGLVSRLFPVLSGDSGGNLVKYILIWLCIISVDKLVAKSGTRLSGQMLFWLGGGITFLIVLGGGIIDIKTALVMAVIESAIVIILANLMYRGIHWLDYGSPGRYLTGEQMISLIICIVAGISGIPEPVPDILSVTGLGYNLYLLYMSYQYGIAAGAMTGAAVGIVNAITIGNAAVSGMYPLVGICVGMVRCLGRISCTISFLSVCTVIAVIYPDLLWNVDQFKNVVSASLCFLLLPRQLYVDNVEENSADNDVMRYNYQYETSRKLNEFSNALLRVSDCFRKQIRMLPVVSGSSAREIFTELTNTVCGDCTNCSYCWGQMYHDTYHEALSMIESAENVGSILKENISESFMSRCIHFDELVNETNRQLEITRLEAWWNNRQAQTRMLIAEQMGEVARLIAQLEKDVLESDRVYSESEAELKEVLRAQGVKVIELEMYKKRNGATDIYMKAQAYRGCVMMKDIVNIVSNVMNNPYRTLDSMPVALSREPQMLTFVKDERYKVLTGTARLAKDGEDLSGDNYSFMKLSNGKLIMTITDGMGTGQNAFRESSTVIELIEQLVEAGFGEDMALRFVNSTMVCSGREEMFSTVDMCVIDLNSGMCECIKCGAAATFIKKKNGVRIINNDAMPIGIIPEMSYASTCYKLNEGDHVIMISDGITDSFLGEDKEYILSRIIEDAPAANATELAEYILESAREGNMCRAVDDMSVIVAGIWYKY